MKVPSVYFYCQNEQGNLQEDVITLAEGFRELGVPFHGNCDYWLQSTDPGDFLIKHDPHVLPDDCDIVVVSYTWPFWVRMRTFDVVRHPLPNGLFRPGRKYATVFMDNHDGYRTISWEPEFRQFDVILRTKFNRRAWQPENMQPWAYGLNNRIIQATSGAAAFSRRRKSILVNFGASHPTPHTTRIVARTRLLRRLNGTLAIDDTMDDLSKEPCQPYDSLMWQQTGGRFSRDYYERLKCTQLVAAFCGDIIPPAPNRPEAYLLGGGRAALRQRLYWALSRFDRRAPRAVGADSFRFWEAMAAGCAVVNIDLEHYGVQLPVMPVNGKHYFGVDFARIDELVEVLRSEPDQIERVAAAGNAWANEHYSPKATAERFLGIMVSDHAKSAMRLY
ncbi:MAG: glycosyltransferase [Acidobacteriota bacterium]